MRTLNLSGFKPSDSLNISVSQGAMTAGPYNVPVWGGGGSGGTITIQTHRSEMHVAPDSVRFWVDLSASTFDTAGPTGGEVYDARLHDLIYLWDMDDTVTTWTAPVNVMAAWKNRNTAKGPFVMHMYPDPGTYSPSVLVIEPSSGKTAVAVLDGVNAITVLDPDDVYPGTATICVNPVGDNDFSAKPAGALEVNSNGLDFQQAPWTSHLGGVAKRWLFKRGGYFEQRVAIGSSTTPGVYFGAYGSGAKPKIANAPWVQDPYGEIDLKGDVPFGIGAYGDDPDPDAPDIRLVNLHGVGTYDPITTRTDYDVIDSKTANWMFNLSSSNLIVYGCDFSGLQGSHLYNGNNVLSKEHAVHLDDCTMTAFGGQYPLFGGQSTNARSATSVTGCRFAQTPGSVGGDPRRAGSSRAIIRANNPHRFHARGCDFYHTDHWQHCVKVPETPVEDGNLVNIHSCSFEGGAGALVFNGNYADTPEQRSYVNNIIVDGVTVLANHSTSMPFSSLGTGVTIRNSLVVIPGVGWLADRPAAFIRIISRGSPPAHVLAAPIRLYNCTFRNDKTTAQNFGFGAPLPISIILHNHGGGYGPEFTGISEVNNVLHQPNIDTPEVAFAPLSGDALWSGRDLGYRNTDPGIGYIKPSALTVANGASTTIAYAPPYLHMTMPALTQASFSGTNGQEQAYFNGTIYRASDGDFTVVYGVSEITVTNTSGVTWSPNIAGDGNWTWIQFDMGSTAPIATDTVPPSGSWKDTKPLTGSAALGAALSGNVSYMDILGTTRTAPADKGAWEVA